MDEPLPKPPNTNAGNPAPRESKWRALRLWIDGKFSAVRNALHESFSIGNSAQRFPACLHDYYQYLEAEFRLLDMGTGAKSLERDRAAQIVEKSKDSLTWADMQVLDIAIMRLQPEAELRRRTWDLRGKLQAHVPAAIFAEYGKSDPPDPKAATLEVLRGDATTIIGLIWQARIAHEARDNAIFRVRSMLFSAWLIGISLAVLAAQVAELRLGLQVAIAIGGATGALVSILRRFQELAATPITSLDSQAELSAMRHGSVSMLTSLFFGAVFAFLLYIVFVAGLQGVIESSLVPQFSNCLSEASCGGGVLDFLRRMAPKSDMDFAKLMVWSFVAGFAERLVPDVIDRLTALKQAPKP